MNDPPDIPTIIGRHLSNLDQLELLFRAEDNLQVHLHPDGQPNTKHVTSYSFCATSIRQGRVGRYSHSLSELDLTAFEAGLTHWLQNTKFMETASFELNKPKMASSPRVFEPPWRPEKSRTEYLRTRADEYRQALRDTWPDIRMDLIMEHRYRTQSIANSLSLTEGYRKFGQRLTIRLYNPGTEQYGFVTYFEDADAHRLVEHCQPYVRRIQGRLPSIEIRGGSSPVLVSPWALATLYSSTIRDLRIGSTGELDLPFPDTFELFDSPDPGDGIHGVPLDDEGTRTKKKLLARGRKVQNYISDLSSAGIHGTTSSGNGFRKGWYLEAASDLAPYPWPCNLLLTGGPVAARDILEQEGQVLLLDQVLAPFSQLARNVGVTSVAFNGLLIEKGQISGAVGGQINDVGGRLLNDQAELLHTNELTNNGRFSYMFQPELVW